MLVSKKGRYSVRAIATLANMARENEKKPVKLLHIAETEKLPVYFIEQLFNKMRKYGIIKSVKGPGGGYKLAKEEEEISLLDILHSVGEFDDKSDCEKEEESVKVCRHCFSRYVWDNVHSKVKEYLRSITIKELVEKQALLEKLS